MNGCTFVTRGLGADIGRAWRMNAARGVANVTQLSRRDDGLDVTDAASVARVMGALEGPFPTVFVSTVSSPEGGAPRKQLAAIDPAVMARVFAVNTIGWRMC